MAFPSQEHIDAAQMAADRVSVLKNFYCWPSVALAQALIESAGWTKLSGKNNGFGIKATQAQIAAGKATKRTTREVINGQSVYIDAWFSDYDSLADAYEAHAMLFVRVKVYAAGLKATNARQFVVEIAKFYATDPTYAKVIIGVMDRLNLYRYDAPGGSRAPIPDAPLQPPAHAKVQAQAPAAGAVVVAGAAAATAAHAGHPALIAGLAVAAIAGAVALWRFWQARQSISHIPATPAPPEAPAAPRAAT